MWWDSAFPTYWYNNLPVQIIAMYTTHVVIQYVTTGEQLSIQKSQLQNHPLPLEISGELGGILTELKHFLIQVGDEDPLARQYDTGQILSRMDKLIATLSSYQQPSWESIDGNPTENLELALTLNAKADLVNGFVAANQLPPVDSDTNWGEIIGNIVGQTDLIVELDSKANVGHGHTAAFVGADPTGTAALTIAAHAATTNHPEVTIVDPGMMIATDKVKLNDIQDGATVNSTDAFLRDRTNHDGVQAISTVTDLQITLNSKATTTNLTAHIAESNPHQTTAAAVGAIALSEKGIALGVAQLDASGIVPSTQLPPQSTGNVASVNGQIGVVVLTSTNVGAEPSGAVTTHEGTTNHPVVTTSAKGLMIGVDKAKLDGIAASATANATDAALRDRLTHTGSQPISTVADLQTTLDTKAATTALTTHTSSTSNPHLTTAAQVSAIALSEKGAVNGVATLDASGLLPSAQLPPIAITDVFPVTTESAMLALTAQVGDVAVRTDLRRSYILRIVPASTLANWQELETPTDTVLSVNGQTGTVSLSAANVGALATANNLLDLTSVSTARTNLGLGSYALKNSLVAADIPNLDTVKLTSGRLPIERGGTGGNFTPIQQGGGIGQSTNKIYFGWSGTAIKAQVDTNDQGDLITSSSILNNNVYGFGTKSIVPNGYQRLPNGLIIQWGVATLTSSNGSDFSGFFNYPTTFPNVVTSMQFNVKDGSDLDIRLVAGIVAYGPSTSSASIGARNSVNPQGTILYVYYQLTGY